MRVILFRNWWLAAAASLLLTASQSHAAYDAFLKVAGISGESTDAAHTNEIVATSFSFGMSNPASVSSGGGISVGKANVSDLTITKFLDSASVPLMQACAQGSVLTTVTLTLRDQSGAQVEFYKVKLTNAVITSVQTSGAASSDTRPGETVTIAYQKISWTYQRVTNGKADGSPVTGSYDVSTGTVN